MVDESPSMSDKRQKLNYSTSASELTTSGDLQKKFEPDEVNIKRLPIEDAFVKSGAFGRFNFASSAINTVVNGACMFFFNSFSFLEVEPQVVCDINGETVDGSNYKGGND